MLKWVEFGGIHMREVLSSLFKALPLGVNTVMKVGQTDSDPDWVLIYNDAMLGRK